MANRYGNWRPLFFFACAFGLMTWMPAAGEAGQSASHGEKLDHADQHKDMTLVGFNDLQARSAYQPIVHKQGDRYIAYIGHHGGTESVPMPFNPLTKMNENNGTSILDVTDPKHPKYLHHIPGQPGLAEQGGAQMVRAC